MTAAPRAIARRTALLLPLTALSGCGMFSGWFGSTKPKLPGVRHDVLPPSQALDVTPGRQVVVPAPSADHEWPQPGGSPAHHGGNLAAPGKLQQIWSADIGAGNGYRQRITAQPVEARGIVFTMDADAVVSAFDAKSGAGLWSFDTAREDNRSTNIGGGIAEDGGTLYAATGRADVLALDARSGKLRWRAVLRAGARSAPTFTDGRLFIPTLDDHLVAVSATDGKELWAYKAPDAATAMLGLPAPAVDDGIVVAGFATGDLQAVRAISGTVVWADNLSAGPGAGPLDGIDSIRAMPLIRDGIVYAVSVGGLMVAIDLPSGRRLWERTIASENTPWLAGDWLYVITAGNELAAVSTKDGKLAWVRQLELYEDTEDKTGRIMLIGPVMAGGRLLIGDSLGNLLIIDPLSGRTLGRIALSAAAAEPPVVAIGMVFIVTGDGTLVALR